MLHLGQKVAEHRMGIGLALKQSAPGHNCVGIVPAAVPVFHSVLDKREDIGVQGLLEPGPCGNRHTPFLSEGNPLVGRGKLE